MKLFKRIQEKKGFTLAELLIVVAIIAVLVAIAIPVFTTQLERSREATDLSNIRAAYAEAVADYLADGASEAKHASVTSIKQTVNGWTIEDPNLYTRVDGKEKAVHMVSLRSSRMEPGNALKLFHRLIAISEML